MIFQFKELLIEIINYLSNVCFYKVMFLAYIDLLIVFLIRFLQEILMNVSKGINARLEFGKKSK